jgi:hypothetical protein
MSNKIDMEAIMESVKKRDKEIIGNKIIVITASIKGTGKVLKTMEIKNKFLHKIWDKLLIDAVKNELEESNG